MISKLLSKRESIAATIFDKLRFRIVVRERSELMPALAHLTRTLFPVNYVIPGESRNNLVQLGTEIRGEPHYRALAASLQRLTGGAQESLVPDNPFSGLGYRVVNWIVDFPVRIDDVIERMDLQHTWMLGRLVYVMVEFQLVDEATAEQNEIGDNDHRHYKARQEKVVEGRLLKGSLHKD